MDNPEFDLMFWLETKFEFSPDGRVVFWLDKTRSLRFRDLADREELATIRRNLKFQRITFSLDSELVMLEEEGADGSVPLNCYTYRQERK